MRRLVVIRPEPGASATCAAAEAAGLHCVARPLFEAEPLAWTPPDPAGFDALLATSAKSFHCGGAALDAVRGLPVHAVGEATADAAEACGFTVATVGSGGIDALLDRLDPDLRLLHIGGEHRREPTAPRQSIAHVPVYRAAEIADPDVAPLAGEVVLVHSARAGARLSLLVEQAGIDRSSIALAAISRDAARAAGAGWEQVAIADHPTDTALLALAARLCNCPSR